MIRIVLCGLLLLGTDASVAQDAVRNESTVDESKTVLSAILVTGEQSGPGLWRATKSDDSGERVLWILGAYAPLPDKMTWRSSQVETIIADAHRVVLWPQLEFDYDAGFFGTLSALPLIFSADKNPNGERLENVVSHSAYEQWLVLKEKYSVESKRIEEIRPTFAAQELRRLALAREGLSREASVPSTVQKLAKKHRVKVVKPEIEINVKIDKPRSILKKFKKADLADSICFSNSLARLESDIETLKLRANAWATGDLETLRSTPIHLDDECTQALSNAALLGHLADDVGARETVEHIKSELAKVPAAEREKWLRAIDDAMQSPGSALLVVPIEKLFDANDGPLAWLRDRGYSVIEP